ncbi:cobyric acid synthase [Desulfocurvibacter africanus]|uniref:Cobyric acid synthase n=1 Tax=Desulfocurvibacter africanus subsp. africanus str. Walvis Bay TaxID=690850 RepID=F3YTT7_DESAF|nr:cobyric acid synthase [Desulfocurvibacter africanus]EGJ48468.1 Cobyric acid synthase [Desulfocurvibacter africanus subsp. africanus str. Walvis Bay]
MLHGGNLRELARQAGCDQSEIIDFSASMNPLGPPPWLRGVISRHVEALVHYPDPDCSGLVEAACHRYGVRPEEVVCGNGTSDILAVLPRIAGLERAIVPVPSYAEYERACRLEGLSVERLDLLAEEGFALPWNRLGAALAAGPALVYMGQPNNPTGRTFQASMLRDLAGLHPDSLFVVDEAFADFVAGLDRLTRNCHELDNTEGVRGESFPPAAGGTLSPSPLAPGSRPANVLTLLSLTKFHAMPGLRLGLALAEPELAAKLRERLPPWSVNSLALAVGTRALSDEDYARRSLEKTTALRQALFARLSSLPGLTVFPGEANFLLCRVDKPGLSAQDAFEHCLRTRVAIRRCHTFPSLDGRYFRVAVRSEEDNARLIQALAGFVGVNATRTKRRTPAIMVQGASSNAGKSLLVAALCRIFLQDGLSPAPFKAQNMSLNSFVTPAGCEIGRAQALQAQACRLPPDARMNPVLLKPCSDTGSQVIVMGKPVGNMRVAQYVAYKPKAWEAARQAYDALSAEAGIMVLEGAGSPAEVNLKHHDIVNMAMARHAGAAVLLVADIDRGGAYASLAGTMDCLEEWERGLVKGYVLNKFRGDASLLAPANDWLLESTGRSVLGVVPYIKDHGLPEEDSVSFKSGQCLRPPEGPRELDIAVIDLPHVSNFTDLDALGLEPDVAVRLVRAADMLGRPDAIILPGSKNTPGDLAFLRANGLAEAVRALAGRSVIVGLCGGYQMLGTEVRDPLGLEREAGAVEAGLGLLPLRTELLANKILTQVSGRHAISQQAVRGYEIHHGRTEAGDGECVPAITAMDGSILGLGRGDGLVWGTYLHGVFDTDGFRRAFLNDLRGRKGLPPLTSSDARYDIEPALDRLAATVRASLDMQKIREFLDI